MTTAWSHLPNAAHIDRVLASLKAHPDAWGATGSSAAREAAWDAAWDAVCDAVWDEAWEAAWTAAVAIGAARGAIVALIAWDNSAKFLDMTPDELEFWAALSKDSAAILILPAVRAFEQIKELELA